jgi:hypothetical protein
LRRSYRFSGIHEPLSTLKILFIVHIEIDVHIEVYILSAASMPESLPRGRRAYESKHLGNCKLDKGVQAEHSTMSSRTAEEIARAAKKAFESSGMIASEGRSTALLAVRAELERHKDAILEANRKDMEVGLCIHYDTSPLTWSSLCTGCQ